MDFKNTDPEVFSLSVKEKKRQITGLELIASENFISAAVAEALGSSFHNKYSEGYPGARYYGGNEVVDELEILCQKRALECFHLDPEEWGVNVQPYSGSTANFCVYTALLGPGGKMMGLNLADGGHLTHGYVTPTGRKLSASSIYFESKPYFLNKETLLVDYDELEKAAGEFKPGLIIAGTSSYTRYLDYKRFKEICVKVGAYLVADMAHISGLVAGKAHPSPFDHADVVTTTTHKSLRGPRHAMIFYRKSQNGVKLNIEEKINEGVFPALQGGPHNHSMAALAVALKEASQESFRLYQTQVVANARKLASFFMDNQISVLTNGTDNHICILDLKSLKVNGARVEHVLSLANISTNRNTLPGDKNALSPNGIRIGTPAVTTRNMKEKEMEIIGQFILDGIRIAQKTSNATQSKLLKDFKATCIENAEIVKQINDLKERVEKFSENFPMPGLDY